MSPSTKRPSLPVIAGGLLLAGSAFASVPLVRGYMLPADGTTPPKTDSKAADAASSDKPKTAEMSCGADKAAMKAEAKPEAKKPVTAKATEGKCGEGKCGEGKCGASS